MHEANPCISEAPTSIMRGLQHMVESRIYEASCEGVLPPRSLIQSISEQNRPHGIAARKCAASL